MSTCIPDCLVQEIEVLGTCLGAVFVEKTGCFYVFPCVVSLVGSLGWLWRELMEIRLKGWAEASASHTLVLTLLWGVQGVNRAQRGSAGTSVLLVTCQAWVRGHLEN